MSSPSDPDGSKPATTADAPKVWTVSSLVAWATEDFRARGIDSPRLDAELIVGHVLGMSRTDIIRDGGRPLEKDELDALRGLVKRRRAREPMAYIRGSREFYGRDFKVNAHVLVPRPDTEILVEVTLRRTHALSLSARGLDLCTGSGCVAVTLARERPLFSMFASDISEDALRVARDNAQRLGAYRIAFVKADLFDGHAWPHRFDFITANPPYIPSAEIASLMPDVRDFEPRLALDGGEDGLAFYRRIVAQAPSHLRPRGVLAFEVGAGEAQDVAALMREHGFVDVLVEKDYARIERVVSGARL
jgi:release factor glutamine methyltransferase